MKSEHIAVLIDNGQWNVSDFDGLVLDVWQNGNALREDVQAVPDEGSNISFVKWETGTVMEVERKKATAEIKSYQRHFCILSKLVQGKNIPKKRFCI